ncbi:Regulator of RpoS [anaerobic digester metagenome]
MPETILIIEDEATFREALRHFLQDAGFAVREAVEASRALELLETGPADMVLLDLGIPGGDGLELLSAMKRIRPAVPVIIVSGRTHIDAAIEAFKAGAWDYVTKPIASMDVFLNAVRNGLAQARLTQRVQDSQEHLFRLVQNLPVIVFSINRNREFEFLNRATLDILGYTPEEIQQEPWAFLKCIAAADRRKFTSALKNGFKAGASEFRLDFRFLHKKGYEIDLRIQSITSPRRADGAPDCLEGMIQDVTRNAYMDKVLIQNERLNMLRSMTEEVAHEIRNPLVSLGGFARQLRARYPDARETEVIMDECNRLERLVQRVNAYLEPLAVSLTRCSVPATLDFVMRLLSIRLEHKSIACRNEIDDDLPAVLADQEFLHRIFIYLIGHGADVVADSGSIRITASTAGGLVHVTLTMSPVGDAAVDEYRLFMPFEDEEVNLAMCSRLVERVGGHLLLTRAEGQSILTVSLPAHP